jgi:HSP20 family molecular chaperone IbpA
VPSEEVDDAGLDVALTTARGCAATQAHRWRMAMLMQFDPFREFDRLVEELAAGTQTPRPFPMDAYRHGDEFIVSCDLPSMATGTIDLTVEQNLLTIKAERRFDGRPRRSCRSVRARALI